MEKPEIDFSSFADTSFYRTLPLDVMSLVFTKEKKERLSKLNSRFQITSRRWTLPSARSSSPPPLLPWNPSGRRKKKGRRFEVTCCIYHRIALLDKTRFRYRRTLHVIWTTNFTPPLTRDNRPSRSRSYSAIPIFDYLSRVPHRRSIVPYFRSRVCVQHIFFYVRSRCHYRRSMVQ